MKEYRFDPEIQLDFESRIPLRVQIFQQVRKAVIRSRIAPGTRVISESSIARDFSINRGTVHLAYLDLVQCGLFESKSPRGGVRIASGAEKLYQNPFPFLNLVLPFSFQDHLKQSSLISLEYTAGVFDRAAEKKISVNIMALPSPGLPPEKIRAWMDGFLSHSIGVITMGSRMNEFDPVLEMLICYPNLPHVFLTGTSLLPHISSVNADVFPGVSRMLDFLEQNGAPPLCFMESAGFRSRQFIFSSADRIRKAMDIARQRSYPFHYCQLTEADLAAEGGVARRYLAEGNLPDVVFCHNDQLACRFIDEMRGQGFSVPEDVKVIGYDNNAPEKYELSSVCHDRFELGKAAVDLIVDLYSRQGSRNSGIHRTIPSSFIARQSSRF